MKASRDTVGPGMMLGRFKLGEPIGTGAMGSVYTAVDPDLGRTVAIKILHDVHSRSRLLREAQAMARLSHPNVVPVHEIGTSEPLFIVMELVAGGTVRDWLREPRPIVEIVDVFVQAGRGLAAAHAAGLVHRDFKPENILRGTDGRVRVVDFGLVASRGERDDGDAIVVGDTSPLDLALTQTGIRIGTPAYMAPEQHRNEQADARSDQFGFAVAFYEGLYGERPFAGTTYREMVRNVYAGAVRAEAAGTPVPAHIRALLLRALAIDPTARFASMTALLAELAATDSSPTLTSRTTAAPASEPSASAVPSSEPSAIAISAPPLRGRTQRAIVIGIAAAAVTVAAIAIARQGAATSEPASTRAIAAPPVAAFPEPARSSTPGGSSTDAPATLSAGPPSHAAAPAPAKPSAGLPSHAAPPAPAATASRPTVTPRTQRAHPAPDVVPPPAPPNEATSDDAAERRRKQLDLSE